MFDEEVISGCGDIDGRTCRCRYYRRFWMLDVGMSTDGRAGAGIIDGPGLVDDAGWEGWRDGGVSRQELPGSVAENEEGTRFCGENQVGDRSHFCCLQARTRNALSR